MYPDDFFPLRNGHLCADALPLEKIAAQFGTPTYVYAAAAFDAAFARVRQAAGPDVGIAFAVKACPHIATVRQLHAAGAGADIVSIGEWEIVRRAGVPAAQTVFSGCGKTDEELWAAVQAGIGRIHVESQSELRRLSATAAADGMRQPICLRLNPDTAAHTLPGITTGRNDDKFGIGRSVFEAAYAEACSLPGLDVRGLSVHIGSQIFDLNDYRRAYVRVAQIVDRLRAAGLPVHELDVGGGFGVPYRPEQPIFDLDGYFALLREVLPGDLRLTCEPGRFLCANAGALLTRVVAVKDEPERKRMVTLDAGMNDLIRPAFYGAHHELRTVMPRGGRRRRVIVSGPVCESSDVFGTYTLPPVEEGDLLLFLSAGAYGAAMSSDYNARPRAAAVAVTDGSVRLIRRRSDPLADEID